MTEQLRKAVFDALDRARDGDQEINSNTRVEALSLWDRDTAVFDAVTNTIVTYVDMWKAVQPKKPRK